MTHTQDSFLREGKSTTVYSDIQTNSQVIIYANDTPKSLVINYENPVDYNHVVRAPLSLGTLVQGSTSVS